MLNVEYGMLNAEGISNTERMLNAEGISKIERMLNAEGISNQ